MQIEKCLGIKVKSPVSEVIIRGCKGILQHKKVYRMADIVFSL